MKNKKVLKIFLVIITLAILIPVTYLARQIFFTLRNGIYKIAIDYDGKIDKSNPMSFEEVVKLLEKGTKYDNYVITKQYEKGQLKDLYFEKCEDKMYVKDNIIRTTKDGKDFYWKDYEKNLGIYLYGIKAAFMPLYDPGITKDEHFKNNNTQKASSYDNIIFKNPSEPWELSKEKEFEYVGEKEINGRETIIIKSIKKDYKTYIKMYIDKQTGVIVNAQEYAYFDLKYKYIDRGLGAYDVGYDFSVEFDCVTDEDVKKPNITGYIVDGLDETFWIKDR